MAFIASSQASAIAASVVAPSLIPTKAGDRARQIGVTRPCASVFISASGRRVTPLFVPNVDHYAMREPYRRRRGVSLYVI
ncbi:MAG: hypothetical protein ACRECP_10405 [Methylocella sp.]